MDRFVFVVCQHGAEKPLKTQAAASPEWRLAFSRPGLLTFKVDAPDAREPRLRSPLVRLAGIGLGAVRGQLAEECFEKVWNLAAAATEQGQPIAWQGIHVFQRDRALPGQFRFEPGENELTRSVAEALVNWLARKGIDLPVNQTAKPGDRVLDIILSEPNQWFVGYHLVQALHQQWPGGVPTIVPPPEMVSRAYLKMAEAILWSRLPIASGDAVVEIGSAPGGASQRLLDIGLAVTGIDAAEMDERIAAHPRFEHWRSKAAAVKRKLYRKFKWLVCDANVAPNYTLDVIEDIVNYEGAQIEGMLLTFKLSGWDQLAHLPEQLKRIGGLGFSRVDARQLAHNRRELCVVAQR
ncbi:MAG: SAM-dependent methyltransferase [Aureliella sp.]